METTRAVIKEMAEIQAARDQVEAVIGRPVLGCDSAASVYIKGIAALNHSTAGLDPAAAKAMWSIVRKQPAKPSKPSLATDRATAARFPGASRLKLRGG
jgi:hypothetical protein